MRIFILTIILFAFLPLTGIVTGPPLIIAVECSMLVGFLPGLLIAILLGVFVRKVSKQVTCEIVPMHTIYTGPQKFVVATGNSPWVNCEFFARGANGFISQQHIRSSATTAITESNECTQGTWLHTCTTRDPNSRLHYWTVFPGIEYESDVCDYLTVPAGTAVLKLDKPENSSQITLNIEK